MRSFLLDQGLDMLIIQARVMSLPVVVKDHHLLELAAPAVALRRLCSPLDPHTRQTLAVQEPSKPDLHVRPDERRLR
jgi:hypothetical protein